MNERGTADAAPAPRSIAAVAPRSVGRRFEARLERRGGAVECLRLPAWAFGVATSLRAELFDSGWLRAESACVPVFSVGNISAGGTGKTPFVAWLARELEQRGRRVGILSRGYGAAAGEANDEAAMLARSLPGVQHVQEKDRVAGAAALAARGVDAIVLDDGFQHRRLARDVDFVLVDATRPWGLPRDASGASVRALLPRGFLRESPRSLARADLVVITRVDQVPGSWLAELHAELELLAPGVARATAVHEPRGVRTADGALEPLAALAGREVELASGIGNPEAFARTVQGLGARIREERRFADHHVFTREDLAGLGQDGRLLLCTAKDQAKLAALGVRAAALEVEFALRSGTGVLEALLDAALDARANVKRQGRVP